MKIIHAQDIRSPGSLAIIVNRDDEARYCEIFAHALVERLQELEFSDDKLTIINAASFLDMPFLASLLAKSHQFSAILTGAFYADLEHSEYLSTLKSCADLAVSIETPILFKGFALDHINQSELHHDARALAERVYTTMSLIRQLA